MKKYLTITLSGILSGILIGIGGISFLLMKPTSLFLGSFLFSIGLFTIIVFSLHLYTGKIGYVLNNKKDYLLLLLFTYLGNLIGAVGFGYLMRLTRLDIIDSAIAVSNTKLNDTPISIFILSILCGFMIFIAVDAQKLEIPGVFKLFAIIMSIIIFVFIGFEHCIADLFYFSLANTWNLKAILYILLITIGNSIGSVIFYLIVRLVKSLNK